MFLEKRKRGRGTTMAVAHNEIQHPYMLLNKCRASTDNMAFVVLLFKLLDVCVVDSGLALCLFGQLND